MRVLVLVFLFACALPAFAEPESLPALWEKATRFESGGHSVEAALFCHRLLLLDPGFTPAREMLAKIHTTLSLPPPATGWRERAASLVAPDRLALGGCLCFWVGVFGVLATLVSPSIQPWRLPAFLILLAGLAGFAFSVAIDPRIHQSGAALVTLPGGASVYPAPSVDDSRLTTRATDGTLVRIRSAAGRWTAITLPDGRQGWILSEALTPLVPDSGARRPPQAPGKS